MTKAGSGTLWRTGTCWVSSKAYRQFFCEKHHSVMPHTLACLLKSVEFDDDVALILGDAGLDVRPHVAP